MNYYVEVSIKSTMPVYVEVNESELQAGEDPEKSGRILDKAREAAEALVEKSLLEMGLNISASAHTARLECAHNWVSVDNDDPAKGPLIEGTERCTKCPAARGVGNTEVMFLQPIEKLLGGS